MSLPTVEVLDTFEGHQDFFSIPEGIKDLFESRGLEVKLISADPRESARRQGMGWQPVLVDDIPEPLRKQIAVSFENPQRHYGEIRRGDCRLVCRTKAQGAAWERSERQKAIRALGNTSIAQEKAGEIGAFMKKRGMPSAFQFTDKNPDASAHVLGGAEIRNDPDLLAELQRRMDENP